MPEKQKTIKKSFSLKGYGLHTGIDVELKFKPASVNYGYRFQRIDLEKKPIIRAIVENVVDTSRSTIIEENGGKVATVEHILSALKGLGIDNVLMEINAEETPILDGSAKLIVEALLEAGIEEQNLDKKYFKIKEKIIYQDEESGAELIIFPDDDFQINTMIDYSSSSLNNQFAELKNLKDYSKEIAPCRTFVFLKELEFLLNNNLIKGGSLDNAIVIIDKKVSQKELDRMAEVFNKPKVKVKSSGILNNLDLHFNNEPARHKLLDLIGDLALVGQDFKGRIFAKKPGHKVNVCFAKKIKNIIRKERIKKSPAPNVDIYAKPLMQINEIQKFLPHRPPFLFVDKVLKMTDKKIIALKNVTMNESFFVGHFPDEPVMPGVLTIEAMAQAGGILVLNTVPDPENYLTFFMKVDKVKFRKQVVPGDTLIFELDLLISPIRRGIANMSAKAFVGDDIVTEGELMAQIVKIK